MVAFVMENFSQDIFSMARTTHKIMHKNEEEKCHSHLVYTINFIQCTSARYFKQKTLAWPNFTAHGYIHIDGHFMLCNAVPTQRASELLFTELTYE